MVGHAGTPITPVIKFNVKDAQINLADEIR